MAGGTNRRHFGHVRKRGSGKWQATYRLDGKYFNVGTFDHKADALAALAEIETKVNRGSWIDPDLGEVSLSNYATNWLDGRHDLAVRTKETYGYLLSKFILPELGHTPIRNLTPSEVRGWNARHATRHPSTASKAYRVLSSIMRTAVVDELITATPCRVKGAGVERPAERPIATIEDVNSLKDAMPDHLKIAIDLAVWCQLRRGEILGLERRDIDLRERTLRVERSRTFLTTGESITKGPKTSAGKRSLVMPTRVVDGLLSHLNTFVSDADDSLVLVGRDGAPITAMSLQRAWTTARKLARREDLHFHDLRHTGLTLAASTGATTAELMRRAGHVSPDAALRYQHATLERDRSLADKLDGI